MGFAFDGIIGGPIPQPRLDHRRAHLARCLVRGCEPLRGEPLLLGVGPHRGYADRHIRWPERGRAGFGDPPPGGIRQHRQRANV